MKACVVDGHVRILVEDSGPGIPEAKRKALFAKFQDSLDVLNQGTGIGLSLSRKLVDLMGADIYLSPDYHSGIENCPGASFVIDLKTEPVEIESIHETLTEEDPTGDSMDENALVSDEEMGLVPELPGELSVLLVDDTYVLRKLYTRTLQKIGPRWSIAEAGNGETALRLVETAKFDLIFVDQYMASVDKSLLGTETVREMRSHGVDAAICGLSANDLDKQFREAGANGFWVKPFPTSEAVVKREIHRLLESTNEITAVE